MASIKIDPKDLVNPEDFEPAEDDISQEDSIAPNSLKIDPNDIYNQEESKGQTTKVQYSPEDKEKEKISSWESLLQAAGQSLGSDEAIGYAASQIIDPWQRVLSHTGLVDKAPSQYMEGKPSSLAEDVGSAIRKPLETGINPLAYLYANEQINKALGTKLPSIQQDKIYTDVRNQIREDARKAISAHPAASFLGAGLGTALTIPLTPAKLLTPLKVAENAGLMTRVAKGAVNAMPTAAIQGAMATEAETLPEQAKDVALITGIGGAFGGTLGALAPSIAASGEKLGGFIEKSAPTVYKAYELGRQGINIFNEYAQKDFREAVNNQLNTLKKFIVEKRKSLITANEETKKLINADIAEAEKQAKFLKDAYDEKVITAQEDHAAEISSVETSIKKAEDSLEKANTEAKKAFEEQKVEDLKKINDDIRLYSRDAQKELQAAHDKVGKQYDLYDKTLDNQNIKYNIHSNVQDAIEALDNAKGIVPETAQRVEGIKKNLLKMKGNLSNKEFRQYRAAVRSSASDYSLPYEVRQALKQHIRDINLTRLNTVTQFENDLLGKYATSRFPIDRDLIGLSSKMGETDRLYSTLMDLDDFISRESLEYAQPTTIDTVAKAKKALESADPKAKEEFIRYTDLLKQLGEGAQEKLGKPVQELAEKQISTEKREFVPAPKESTTVKLNAVDEGLAGDEVPYAEAQRRLRVLQDKKDRITDQIPRPKTAEELQQENIDLQKDIEKQKRLEERLQTPHTATEEYGKNLKVAQEDLPDVMSQKQQSFIDEGTPLAPDESISFTKPSEDKLMSRLINERKGVMESGNLPAENPNEPYIERLLREYERVNKGSKLRQDMIESNKISKMFNEIDEGLEQRTLHGLYTSPKTYAGVMNLAGRGVRFVKTPIRAATDFLNKIDPRILSKDAVAKAATLNTLLQNESVKKAMQREGITEQDLKNAINNKFVGPPEE